MWLQGAETKRTGNCGGAGTTISVNPVAITPVHAITGGIADDDLVPGDYKLSIDIDPAAVDVHAVITVTYPEGEVLDD